MKPVLGTQLDLKHQLNKGLVGCWLMNERAGNIIHDISGNKNNGLIKTGTTWNPGKYGNTLYFDGTDGYIDCGDVCDMGLHDSTLSIWFQKSGSTYTLIAKSHYSGADYRWGVLDAGSGLYAFIDYAATYNAPVITGLSDDTWYHYAAVYDRDGYLSQYLNGIYQSQVDISGIAAIDIQSTYYLFFGRYNDGSTGQLPYVGLQLDGKIDEVRIYNRALSAAEIKELYLAKFKPVS